jgi:hypothetical protein
MRASAEKRHRDGILREKLAGMPIATNEGSAG